MHTYALSNQYNPSFIGYKIESASKGQCVLIYQCSIRRCKIKIDHTCFTLLQSKFITRNSNFYIILSDSKLTLRCIACNHSQTVITNGTHLKKRQHIREIQAVQTAWWRCIWHGLESKKTAWNVPEMPLGNYKGWMGILPLVQTLSRIAYLTTV